MRASADKNLCDHCQRADTNAEFARAQGGAILGAARSGTVVTKRPPIPETVDTPTTPLAKKIRRLKRDIVADLVARDGSFWEAVQIVRTRWEIMPVARVPPADIDYHVPAQVTGKPPNFDLFDPRKESADFDLWRQELRSLRSRFVPETHQKVHHDVGIGSWNKFLSACLLYDPPLDPPDNLEQFAAYGKLGSETGSAASEAIGGNKDNASPVEVGPIKTLRDPERVRENALWYYESAIGKMGDLLQQRLEQAGIKPEQLKIDIWELYYEAVTSVREPGGEHLSLLDKYSHRTRRIREDAHSYIDPLHERATEKNVVAALRDIRASHGHNFDEGAETRDRLTAIRCALLYDHHNPPNPEDGRRRRWSYRRLTEELGLDKTPSGKRRKSPKRIGEYYVALGREELKAREEA